jgi:hypothetical protein
VEQTKRPQRDWLDSEDGIWSGMRKRERRRRDLLWLLVAVLFLVIGSFTRFPARLLIRPSR